MQRLQSLVPPTEDQAAVWSRREAWQHRGHRAVHRYHEAGGNTSPVDPDMSRQVSERTQAVHRLVQRASAEFSPQWLHARRNLSGTSACQSSSTMRTTITLASDVTLCPPTNIGGWPNRCRFHSQDRFRRRSQASAERDAAAGGVDCLGSNHSQRSRCAHLSQTRGFLSSIVKERASIPVVDQSIRIQYSRVRVKPTAQ